MTGILQGDCREVLKTLEGGSVDCCVTSPPYFGLRDYKVDGQIGLERTPDAYVAEMVAVFHEVRRCLRDDGTLWLNLGDSYCGYHGNSKTIGLPSSSKGKTHYNENARTTTVGIGVLKPKDLIGIPWRVAFALQADGWYLRQDIIWHKPNPMPESVKDRCTKSHEYMFLLSKNERYFFDAEAIAQPLAESSKKRLEQPNLPNQRGSDRVPGKTNGNMKAVGPRFGGNKYGDDEREEARTKSGNEWKGNSGKANRRDVWTIATKPYKGAHFATFPPELVRPCILAGCPKKGLVLDPFGGSGTTAQVANEEGRDALLVELNPEYVPLIKTRLGL